MDKQQFDHIDNSIRQAADDISIPFNETAWEKMSVKLDNEFNKDRRRIGFWWWFSAAVLIIAASGMYFFYYGSLKPAAQKTLSREQNRINKPSATTTASKHTIQSDITTVDKNDHDAEITGTQSASATQAVRQPSVVVPEIKPQSNSQGSIAAHKAASLTEKSANTSDLLNNKMPVGKKVEKRSRMSKQKTDNISDQLIAATGKKRTASAADRNTFEGQEKSSGNLIRTGKAKNERSEETAQTTNEVAGKSLITIPDSSSNLTSSSAGNAIIDSAKSLVSARAGNNAPAVKTDSIKSVDSVSKKAVAIKMNSPTPRGFYFTASLATDATGVKDKLTTKEMKPVYGIGVGYRFNKRLGVETGFYFGNKVYSAGPDDYYTKPGSYIATIISAEAACYIYDIPISLRYDVLKQKNSNIYIMSGLSSYILKREYYDMHFLNPTGAYHHMSYTYKDNTDYFSIFDFSIGYERKISDAFSVQAQPYFKLPLSGVGEGSVKLYSIGLQLGVKYQPFHKKK